MSSAVSQTASFSVRALLVVLILLGSALPVLAQETPRVANARFSEGFKAWQQGQWNVAIARFREGLNIFDRNAAAHYYIARSYGMVGNVDEAYRHYRRVLEIAPESKEARDAGIEVEVFEARKRREDQKRAELTESQKAVLISRDWCHTSRETSGGGFFGTGSWIYVEALVIGNDRNGNIISFARYFGDTDDRGSSNVLRQRVNGWTFDRAANAQDFAGKLLLNGESVLGFRISGDRLTMGENEFSDCRVELTAYHARAFASEHLDTSGGYGRYRFR